MLRSNLLEDGFEILFKNYVVTAHSSKVPLLMLGQGDAECRMRHGSFKFKDRIAHKAEALGQYQFEHKSDKLIRVRGESALVEFKVINGRLEITFDVYDPGLNRIWFRLSSGGDEFIFGGGEQYSTVNLFNRTLPLWCQEQGVGRGRDLITFLAELSHGSGGSWHTTYFPQPTFVSSRGWYCHIDGSAYMEAKFGPGSHMIHAWEVPLKVIIGRQDNPCALLEDLTGLLGRQPSLPEWTNDGVWLGVQGGSAVVEKKLADALAAGVKVAALWCQDWPGIRMTSFGKQLMWNWEFDADLYPELPDFVKKLQAGGVRFLGYINPFLALEGELYWFAKSKGYLVGRPGGEEYQVTITDFPAAMLDLTNPEALMWIKGVIQEKMIGVGMSGWMADFGEYLPLDAVLHSGESAETFHNRYPVEWARINREAVTDVGMEDEVTFFTRAGYSGTANFAPLVWAGDQLVNWSIDDGLASVIPAAISLGFSGIGHFHSDIGGYTTVAWIKRSKELFMRWAELSAFSAVMRTHEGNRPDANWQFNSDAETLAHFARMSKIHYILKPYIREGLNQYQQYGLPLMRHLWLHYPHDRDVLSLNRQYLFGRDLLVAPVYKRRRKKCRLYFPDERWVHLWSGKEFQKGRRTVDAPLGKPAVFYRADSSWRELFEEIGATSRRGEL